MTAVPPDPNLPQRAAADARVSAWVVASAGTGKTKVLTDRVLNLLLGGTAPARILCLTFTKAAAAEMVNRLNRILSSWATRPSEALAGEILALTGRRPEPDLAARARRLFAEVLETPGGMQILTIHAFCQSLLRRFPLEAGVAPHFEVMDERSAAELLAEVQAEVLTHARENAGPLAAALTTVTENIHELGFTQLLSDVIGDRSRFGRIIEAAGGFDRYLAELRAALGVAEGETVASRRRAFCDEVAFDGLGLRRAATVLGGSSAVTDCRAGEGLADWLAADLAGRVERLGTCAGVFLTKTGEPRKSLATKKLAEAHPWLEPLLRAEQARWLDGQRRLAAAQIHEASAALARLAAAFLDAYEAEKRRRVLLDYDDLILAARALLHRPGLAPWVLFKLDGGLDHILIDEAQDTNPEQWAVVAALAEEFFAGTGARDPYRTIFAVGDAKQSIFSFQGADPDAFRAMQAHFEAKVVAAEQEWRSVPLDISFRSTEAVLQVVDAVFARDEARAGVALDAQLIRHTASRAGEAGRVELWPPLEPPDAADTEPWQPPLTQETRNQPRARLARLIAATIAYWIETKAELQARGRPIRAGDVLVLVRRRAGFVAELVRELKRLGVPVAGADRIVVTQQIAVLDLMALGQFLLLPEDDLTLAAVLKSPLVGLDEDQLFAVAHGRPSTLWAALKQCGEPWAQAAASLLGNLMARADFVPPHELYAGLLADGGRERLIHRLGHEAEDAIDEFIAQTLAYEATRVPSLQGFLHWLGSAETEVKRDLDTGAGDEVRIMTVHGSKGLQAPIVFLPDTIAVPTKVPSVLWSEVPDLMLWPGRAGAAEPLAARAKARAIERRDDEYRRLLYVALTRAADQLYVCGWRTGRSSGSTPSWYDLIESGMTPDPLVLTPITLPPGCEPFERGGLVVDRAQTVPVRPDAARSAAVSSAVTLPAFARSPAPAEPAPPRPLIASRPSAEEPPALSPLTAVRDQARFQRGILIHRMMQSLPELPSAEAEVAARRFLAQPGHGLEPELQDQMARETLAVLRHPDFAPLFGPGSRAEVPLVGLIEGRALSARVDRLVATDREVMVIDYKTNRPPPTTADAVSPAYREQMAAYRGALERIYPGRRVRTLLLWTDGPSLMEIAPDAAD